MTQSKILFCWTFPAFLTDPSLTHITMNKKWQKRKRIKKLPQPRCPFGEMQAVCVHRQKSCSAAPFSVFNDFSVLMGFVYRYQRNCVLSQMSQYEHVRGLSKHSYTCSFITHPLFIWTPSIYSLSSFLLSHLYSRCCSFFFLGCIALLPLLISPSCFD